MHIQEASGSCPYHPSRKAWSQLCSQNHLRPARVVVMAAALHLTTLAVGLCWPSSWEGMWRHALLNYCIISNLDAHHEYFAGRFLIHLFHTWGQILHIQVQETSQAGLMISWFDTQNEEVQRVFPTRHGWVRSTERLPKSHNYLFITLACHWVAHGVELWCHDHSFLGILAQRFP